MKTNPKLKFIATMLVLLLTLVWGQEENDTDIINYKIIYNANYGTNEEIEQIIQKGTYEEEITLSEEKPTRDGYKFTGWNTQSGGDGDNYKAGDIYKFEGEIVDVTLYAQWIQKLIGSVVIDGTPQYNEMLTANTSGLSIADDITLIYQWLRSGEDEEKEEIATSETYKAAAEDIGKTISVLVKAEKYYGAIISGGVEIDKKPITITAEDKFIYIGWDEPEYTYITEGLLENYDLDKPPQFSLTTTFDNTKAGTFEIEPYGADAGGNYKITYANGTLTVSEKEDITEDIIFEIGAFTYNGQRQPLTATYNGSNDNFTYAYTGTTFGEETYNSDEAPTEAGNYKVKAFYEDDSKKGETDEVDLTINRKSIEEEMFNLTSPTFTGEELEPEITGYYNDYNVTFDVSYSNNINAGTGYANIIGTGNYSGNLDLEFEILKAIPTIVFPTTQAVTYDKSKTLADVELIGGSIELGNFEWDNPNTVPEVENNGYLIKFTQNNDNYEWTDITLTAIIELTVNKATPELTKTPTDLTATYGQTLADVSLEAYEGWSWINEAALVGDVGEQTHNAIYNPDTKNYNNSETTLTVTVSKAIQTAPSAPTMSSRTSTSITLDKISGAEYKLGEDGEWQDEAEFANLESNTEYSFYARLKETDTHNASLASYAKEISTLPILIGSVTIDGTPQYNEMLTANTSGLLTTYDILHGALAYQWQRNEENIDGATYKTYTATTTDVGQEIRVLVTAANYYGNVTSIPVTIEKAQILNTDIIFKIGTFTYNGQQQSPTAIYISSSNDNYFTYAYTGTTLGEAPTEAGDYKVKAFYESENEIGETEEVEFTIEPKPISISKIIHTKEYDGTEDIETEITAELKTEDIIDGDDVYVSEITANYTSKDVVENPTVNITAITLGGEKAHNYTIELLQENVPVEGGITKATPEPTKTPKDLTATYGQTLADVSLEEYEGWSWADVEISVGDVGERTHNAIYNPDTKNYNNSAATLTVTVSKASQTTPSAPTMASRTSISITLDKISGAEYKLGENEEWQDEVEFANLEPNTEYSFYARLKGTSTHNVSLASDASKISTLQIYIVTFKDWNDAVLDAKEVEHGSPATAPDDPEREGYTFTGWDIKFNDVTSALTVNAIYAIKTYTITYRTNGGTSVPEAQTKFYDAELKLSDFEPTRTGYTFSGWNTESDGSGTNYVPEEIYTDNASLTLYAQWTLNTYTVTFIDHDETELHTVEVEHGSSATAPEEDPEREGYIFTGWDVKFDEVTNHLTVTATYEKEKETETQISAIYIINAIPTNAGGSVNGGGTYKHGDSVTLTAIAKYGYKFVNWTENRVEVSKDNSYQFTATANRIFLVANFESETTPINSLQIASAQISVQAINGGILLENLPSNANIELYNLQGKQVYLGNSGNSKILQILIQTKGVYIVKADKQKFSVVVK